MRGSTVPAIFYKCPLSRGCPLFITRCSTVYIQTVRSHPGELVTGISAVAILEIRRSKSRFLEAEEDYAESALGELAFLDFEQDEYSIEVAEEALYLLREVVLRCKTSTIILEALRRIKSIADNFNERWDKMEQVQLVSQIVENAIQNSRKRSRVYQSALALLKDLSLYESLKAKKLNKEPLSVIAKLRGDDQVDADVQPPEAKRQHLSEDEGDKYISLMESLANSEGTEEILHIENQIQELGYEPNIL